MSPKGTAESVQGDGLLCSAITVAIWGSSSEHEDVLGTSDFWRLSDSIWIQDQWQMGRPTFEKTAGVIVNELSGPHVL